MEGAKPFYIILNVVRQISNPNEGEWMWLPPFFYTYDYTTLTWNRRIKCSQVVHWAPQLWGLKCDTSSVIVRCHKFHACFINLWPFSSKLCQRVTALQVTSANTVTRKLSSFVQIAQRQLSSTGSRQWCELPPPSLWHVTFTQSTHANPLQCCFELVMCGRRLVTSSSACTIRGQHTFIMVFFGAPTLEQKSCLAQKLGWKGQ